MISARNLVKRFGLKSVLRGLDFEVAEGEFVGLLGPNGAGKTTFLRILASLARPSLGRVEVAGFSLPEQAAQVRRRLGVLSHQPLLYPDLTGEENLTFFGRLYNVQNLPERIRNVLALVGLEGRGRDLVRTYSRGMQQRLAIGRAVIHDPDILLLDEPYTGLDQDASAMLDDVLRKVTAEGRTVVMTSHDLVRAQDLCSRFDVLTRGRILASASRQDVPPDGLQAFYRRSVSSLEPGRAGAHDG
ncbi:MAG: heme ABC exporter ATP-binding protein CcmA [Chloroflexi bacterium]|nr:heme ABC exporter ATP-binding protein CcmA [Chloroflexota bacterium]